MFTVTRLEVSNLGSVPHAVIEPATSGITALDGPTGSGKSSLLNAIVFALYGHVGGVESFNAQRELRFDLCPAGEPAQASVEFVWKGVTYRAVRSLIRSKNGTETAQAELWIDGVQQLNMSPDRLSARMEEITGLSGRSFVSTFFIPQMHLEQLASGKPAEIQSLIEERTGLSGLTTKIKQAREQVRNSEAAAQALPGSTEEVDAAQQAVDVAQQAAADAWQQWETDDSAQLRARQVRDSAAATLAGLQTRRDTAQQAQRTLAELAGRHATLTDTLTAARDDLAAAGGMQVDVAAVTRRVDEVRRAVTDVTAARQRHQFAAERATATHNALQSARDTAAQTVPDAAARLADVETQLAAAKEQYAWQQATYKQVKGAYDTLMQVGPDTGVCPTCRQAIPDPTHLAGWYQQQLAGIVAAGRHAKTVVDDLNGQHAVLVAAADTARDTQRVLTDAEQQHREAAGQVSVAADMVNRAVAQLAHLTGVTDGADAEAAAVALDTQLSGQVAAAQRHQQLVDRVNAVEQQLADVAARITQAETQAADVVPDDQWQAAKTAAADADQAWQAAAATAHTSHVEAERRRSEVAAREQVRDQARALLDVKVAAMLEAETVRLAALALAEQRKELLGQYTATISDAASRIMERIGGGRHVGVQLGLDFVPRVVLADGRTRPVRSCSGGEKLRAALCLCLGQVEQQDGGTGQGMIFADEIATGYDSDTTLSVLDMVTELERPVVLIGHNPEVRQIAQKVYEVANPNDQGSIVTLAGADTPTVTAAQPVTAVTVEGPTMVTLPGDETPPDAAGKKPAARRTRKTTASSNGEGDGAGGEPVAPKPATRRRTTRKPAAEPAGD